MIKNRMLFHYRNKKSASKGYLNNSEYFLSVIFAGNIFYDCHIDNNPKDFQLIINYINFLNKHFKIAKKLYPALFNFFFGKFLSNSYLPFKYKKDLMKELKIPKNCDSYLHYAQRSSLKESFNNISYLYNQAHSEPKLSIIIIIHNNFENISNLINSFNAQKFVNFEIILSLDNIEKNNYDLIKNYVKNYNYIKLHQ